LMLVLRVLAIDRFAGRTDLLHDPVAVVRLHNLLDARIEVTRGRHEVVAVFQDLPVLRRPELDELETASTVAFAVVSLGPADPVQLGARLNPLVDVTKDLFVARSALGEIHAAESGASLEASAAGKAANDQHDQYNDQDDPEHENLLGVGCGGTTNETATAVRPALNAYPRGPTAVREMWGLQRANSRSCRSRQQRSPATAGACSRERSTPSDDRAPTPGVSRG